MLLNDLLPFNKRTWAESNLNDRFEPARQAESKPKILW